MANQLNSKQQSAVVATVGLVMLNAVAAWSIWDFSESQPEQHVILKLVFGVISVVPLTFSTQQYIDLRRRQPLPEPDPNRRQQCVDTITNNKFLSLTTTVFASSTLVGLGLLSWHARGAEGSNQGAQITAGVMKSAGTAAALAVSTLVASVVVYCIDRQRVCGTGAAATRDVGDDRGPYSAAP